MIVTRWRLQQTAEEGCEALGQQAHAQQLMHKLDSSNVCQ